MRRGLGVLALAVALLLALASVSLAAYVIISGAWIVLGFVLVVATMGLGVALLAGWCGCRLRRQADSQQVEPFADAVRRELGFLLESHGFQLVHADSSVVQLHSPTLGVQAAWDPRGEVSVDVFMRELGGPAEGWSYSGMVGKASVSRLLAMAGEQLRAQPWVLAGDRASYEGHAAAKSEQLRQWTAYYSRQGPRPHSSHLL